MEYEHYSYTNRADQTALIVQKLEPSLIMQTGAKNKGKEVMGVPEEGDGGQPGSAKKLIKLKRLNLEPENDSEKELCTRIKQKAHKLHY